jgi:hypothetical protein
MRLVRLAGICLMAFGLTACGPDPILGKWFTQKGGGIEFEAGGKCNPTYKRGEPDWCTWKKRDDGRYEFTDQTDVATVKIVASVDGDKLVFAFAGSKLLVLSRASKGPH